MGDFEEVPGDCVHMPGNPYAKESCTLCKPKPKVVESVGQRTTVGGGLLRRHAPSVPARTIVWVHAECGGTRRIASKTADYRTRCVECDDQIEEGDDIVAIED